MFLEQLKLVKDSGLYDDTDNFYLCATINDVDISKLYEMRLTAMADSYREQLKDNAFSDLSFEERFGLVVDLEWSRRKNNKLTKLIKKADFRFSNACVEDIEYHADRKLDKTLITRLSTCNYIQEKHNVIVLGASGNGNYAKYVVMQSSGLKIL